MAITTPYNHELLERVHPYHGKLHNRWRFLYDSYMGGEDFKSGDYLTRYVYETETEYINRKAETPLDNHCRNIISTYTSYLFKDAPQRDLGNLQNRPSVVDFLKDADYEGRNFNHFMHDVATMSSIFGTAWIVVDKPTVDIITQAQAELQGIRPYISIVNPINVVDWDFSRRETGKYELTYVKIFETTNDDNTQIYRIYTPDATRVVKHDRAGEPDILAEYPNPLGYIPIVIAYNNRSFVRGIGISDIADIADQQLKIANLNSELIQLARISNHPSLVKTDTVTASAGAGSIITLPETLPEGLKPYLLQPSNSNMAGLLESMQHCVETIDKLAHLGGIRNTATRSQSGVALQTEFTLLNSKLTEKAHGLELTEEQIWNIWADWEGVEWQGKIEYMKMYNTRDTMQDLKNLQDAMLVNMPSKTFQQAIRQNYADILVDDQELMQVIQSELEGAQIDETETEGGVLSAPGEPGESTSGIS